MKQSLLILLLLSTSFYSSQANEDEKHLRKILFKGYNKNVRPVKNPKHTLNVTMGLAIQNLESFNQKEEAIKLNIWHRITWLDKQLSWNISTSKLTFLSLDKEAWIPDIELLNAAALPEIYTLKGGMMLYQDGTILWSKPGIYKFSCSLQLEDFPFDIQNCKMKFGSWIFSKNYINLQTYPDKDKEADIMESFSHSEWEIQSVDVEKIGEERDCCPDEEFPIIEYNFELKRYTHYYKLSMGMTIALVIVSFIIMLVESNNVSRTSTAVFIPLTILALQLTIADKIPVVGYYTLMDKFFLCCFITSMIVSIESGLVYTLITTNSKYIYGFIEKYVDIKKLYEVDKKKRQAIEKKINKHNADIVKCKLESNKSNYNNDDDMEVKSNEYKETSIDDEFNSVGKALEATLEATLEASLEESLEAPESPKIVKLVLDDNVTLKQESIVDEDTKDNSLDLTESVKSIDLETNDNILPDDIVKTIPYDSKFVKFTYKEYLIYTQLVKYTQYFDNAFRMILPIIYFSYIGSLLAKEQ